MSEAIHKRYEWPKLLLKTTVLSAKKEKKLHVALKSWVKKTNEFGTVFYIPVFNSYIAYYSHGSKDLPKMIHSIERLTEGAISSYNRAAIQVQEKYNTAGLLTDLIRQGVIIENNKNPL